MSNRLVSFVHTLYFDIQTIEGVKPLEIWNGVREFDDPFEKTGLVKNLYKIAVPLVNEAFFGRPFEQHSRAARETVSEALSSLRQDKALFERFPYPPVGDADQKALYRLVKDKTRAILARGQSEEPARGERRRRRREDLASEMFPDGLFDFREMRIVDNELPYIIFTDKEFRVIHGLAIVYLWLIGLDEIFLETLDANGVDPAIGEEYRQFCRRVQKENPLTIHGKKMDSRELVAHIHEKLKYEDYLDLFENVYRWFEQTSEKFRPAT